jgi:4-carboxymuconolactone decarboxylase
MRTPVSRAPPGFPRGDRGDPAPRRAAPALTDAGSRAVHAVARELHETRSLSDATYATAAAALGRKALVDLVGLLGYYTLVSMTLNAFAVPTPDGSRPFAE